MTKTRKNPAYAAYLRRTRQTPAMKLTDEINRLATPKNAARYAELQDQWVFCADLLGLGMTPSHEAAIQRLENKLIRLGEIK